MDPHDFFVHYGALAPGAPARHGAWASPGGARRGPDGAAEFVAARMVFYVVLHGSIWFCMVLRKFLYGLLWFHMGLCGFMKFCVVLDKVFIWFYMI